VASRSLDDLAPIFRARVDEWLADCEASDIDVLVYCTLRSGAEQDALYKVGRTVKGAGVTQRFPMGRKVTNAQAGQSAHQYGLAIDFVPMILGKAAWSNKELYGRAIQIAAARRMASLMPMEMAHLQMPNWREYIK